METTKAELERMEQILNYSLHHHLTEEKTEAVRFLEEDKEVLERLADYLNDTIRGMRG